MTRLFYDEHPTTVACRPGLNAGTHRLSCGWFGPTWPNARAAASGLTDDYQPVQCVDGHWHARKARVVVPITRFIDTQETP